ncbi:MAG TPA: hypothetical protein VFJ60_09350 [Gaiella sp.]|nr:hypothetical protein [Gaiella sp.]
MLDDWQPAAPSRTADAVCPSCRDREGSDPSAVPGLVTVLLANTAVVAALVAAAVLILA